jgi:uncharacterized membrane protein
MNQPQGTTGHAIYWNNHHHMLFVTERISGGVLWANMHLLFWLSLIPFATAWMGENDFARVPTAVYGAVVLMDAIAYYILQRSIIHSQGEDSLLARAVGRDLRARRRRSFVPWRSRLRSGSRGRRTRSTSEWR